MNILVEKLRAVVGTENVTVDSLECEFYSQDVYSARQPVAAVVAPGNKGELAAVVKEATGAGTALVPRGGGMSYTSGYLPTEENSITVDMSRMNRVLEVNREDMYITVEGGTTWAQMSEALKGTGLRTPYWGPLSGLYATVGGSMSQNSIFFGSGRYGSASDSVIGFEVVLADGSVLNTGSASQVNASPFFRHYGPDLTGLFTGDCGALGFKATATLRLIPELEAQAFGSFAFENYADTVAAMSEIARHDIVTECFGFDPYLQKQRMKRDRLSNDIKKLKGVLKSAGSVGKAIRDGAKMAVAGRGFMDDVKWSFHVMIEAHTDASAKACLEKAREIVKKLGGRELPDSIPRLVRANPFGPVNNMVGPEGERWVPVHALVPHSRAKETMGRIEALFAENRDALQENDIHAGYLLATVSTNCFVIEPVFFWPDELMEMHRRSVEPEHLKRLKVFPENLVAREIVGRVRNRMMEILEEVGAVHLQIGKSYRYSEGLRPESLGLVRSLKKTLDPDNRINPGSLGL
jgi:FAD/FMN-containing dehydrogenase